MVIDLRLSLDLVPASSWLNNVRAVLTPKQWDMVRRQVYDRAWHICEICEGIGPKHPVECHEIWHYDDRKQTQKLVGMVALCPACHRCKHMGLAQMRGKGEQALCHFMKVNRLIHQEAQEIIQQAFEIWEERSRKQWTLDIFLLKDYGIDISKIKYKEKII